MPILALLPMLCICKKNSNRLLIGSLNQTGQFESDYTSQLSGTGSEVIIFKCGV